MADKDATLAERVQNSYKQLTLAAINLNIASDELSRAVSVLEKALCKLNLGLSAWTTITDGGDESGEYWWSRDVGYTQYNSEWVLALRSSSGYYAAPQEDSTTVWPFGMAPRWMQDEAVPKLPDLLDKLISQAEETRKKLKNRATQVQNLAAVIEEVSKREEDWLTKLQFAAIELGLPALAETLAQPEVAVDLMQHALLVKFPKRCKPNMCGEELRRALEHLGCPDLRFNLAIVPDKKAGLEQKAHAVKQ